MILLASVCFFVCFVVFDSHLPPCETTGYLHAFDGVALPGVSRAAPQGGRRKGFRGWGPLVGGRPRRLGDGTERNDRKNEVCLCVGV